MLALIIKIIQRHRHWNKIVWRERRNLGKYNKQARYSLLVSISIPSEDVDIYTPVAIEM